MNQKYKFKVRFKDDGEDDWTLVEAYDCESAAESFLEHEYLTRDLWECGPLGEDDDYIIIVVDPDTDDRYFYRPSVEDITVFQADEIDDPDKGA